MASAFAFSQGHQVNLGSLAVDILFGLLDHLSVPDVLRFRQVCNPVSLQNPYSHPLIPSVLEVNKHFERDSRHAAVLHYQPPSR